MTLYMKWLRTKLATVKASKVYTIVISRNKIVFIFVRGVVHLVSYPFLSIVHYCKNRYLCAHYQINFNEKYTQFLYYCTYRPRKKYPGRSLVGVYQNHCRQRFTGSSFSTIWIWNENGELRSKVMQYRWNIFTRVKSIF